MAIQPVFSSTPRVHNSPGSLLALFGYFFAFCTLVVAGFTGWHGYQTHLIRTQWPAVNANVIECKMVSSRSSKGGTAYATQCQFSYEVSGQKYTGYTRTGYKRPIDPQMKKWIEQHPRGSLQVIHYDPSHPGIISLAGADADIDPQSPQHFLILGSIFGAAAAIFLSIGFLFLRKENAKKAREEEQAALGIRPSAAEETVPDPSWKVLQNHPTQSTIAIDRWASIFFGLPFVIAALPIALANKTNPAWLAPAASSPFFFAGIFLMGHGVHGLIRRSANKRDAGLNPGEPWLADHHWNTEGSSFSAFQEMLKRLLAALIWTAIPVAMFWGYTKTSSVVFLAGSVLVGLISLIFWTRWFLMLANSVRYGNSFLAFGSFPFFAGQTMQVRLRTPHYFSQIEDLTVTLRCVKEMYIITGSGKNRQTTVVCYELCKHEQTFSRDQLAYAAGDELALQFAIPADVRATNLAGSPPTYWEIQAAGKARGADYEAYFLVPVYKLP